MPFTLPLPMGVAAGRTARIYDNELPEEPHVTVRFKYRKGEEELTSLPLLPLRIPTRWAVLYNNFVDVDYRSVSPRDRDRYFSQDLLLIAEVALREERWVCPEDGYLLDVGWYDADTSGEYRLHILRGDWDHILGSVVHGKAKFIQAALEECMDLLGRKFGELELEKYLARINV